MIQEQIDEALENVSEALNWLENIDLPEDDSIWAARKYLDEALNSVDNLRTELELMDPESEDD